jgi:5-(aminomethyl)-3-furanmethanol phosphate kinase
MHGAGRIGRLVVIKLGGSLMGDGPGLRALLKSVVGAPGRCVIVCGGGVFADAVRQAQAHLEFSNGLAHRLALDSMGQFAEVLCEMQSGLGRATDAAGIAAAHAAGLVPVWVPTDLRAGHPAVPEGWEVTSDSLAVFVATEIGAEGLILVKSVEHILPSVPVAPPSLARPAFGAAGLVDAAFPAFAARYTGVVRVLGRSDWPRLAAAIADPAADIGLAIKGL